MKIYIRSNFVDSWHLIIRLHINSNIRDLERIFDPSRLDLSYLYNNVIVAYASTKQSECARCETHSYTLSKQRSVWLFQNRPLTALWLGRQTGKLELLRNTLANAANRSQQNSKNLQSNFLDSEKSIDYDLVLYGNSKFTVKFIGTFYFQSCLKV